MSASSEHAAFLVSDVYAPGELLDEHRVDLARSGLTDATVRAARLRTVPPADLPKLIGPRLAALVTSALLIPYDDGAFYRCKLFPPVADHDGRTQRYYQPPDTAPRLYVPPGVRPALADPARELFVVEGEKKSLRGAQEGLVCVALGGLWSWRTDGRLLPDFDAIDFCDRVTEIVPDSDVWARPDLRQAVYALGRELQERGACVAVVKLPPSPDGLKVGLDDLLEAHGRAAFDALPRLPLKHAVFKSTEGWWKGWRARGDAAGVSPSAVELLAREDPVHHIHPAQDVHDGVLYYTLPVAGGALVVVTSAREVLMVDELRARGLALRHTEPGVSSLTRDTAMAFRGGATGSVGAALDGIAAWLARYVVFRDPRTPAWLAAWIVGTWIYRGFRVFPYLHLRSIEKRCGKTRLMKLLTGVGFNASSATAAPTEAFLFREAQRRSGVQAFDEMESLKGGKDAERFAGLLAVFNAGFERGGAVARQEKRGDRFVTVEYEVFAPRILAGLSQLKDTLEDRALPVMMARRRRDESYARITTDTETKEAAELRDRCALAVLSRAQDILDAVGPATALLHGQAVDDRAVDLWAPLLALAVVADAEVGGARAGALLALAQESSARRNAGDEEGMAARLVEALLRVRESHGERVAPSELLAALRGGPEWEWVRTTRALAGLLGPLGLVSRTVRDGARTFRGYVLEQALLKDMSARYRPTPDPGAGAPDEA